LVDLADFPGRGDVEEPNGAVVAAHRRLLAVGREGQIEGTGFERSGLPQLLARRGVPKAEDAVGAAGEQGLAIRGEGYPRQHVADKGQPAADGAGDDDLARAAGWGGSLRLRDVEAAAFLAGGHVPLAGRAVLPDREQDLPAGQEGHEA